MRLFTILIVLFLSACNQYTLVKQEQMDINGLTITPAGMWSEVPSSVTIDGSTMWTADGVMLNSIMFFSGVADGEPLVKEKTEEQFPVYDKTMLPNEIVELVESTIAKLYRGNVSGSQGLKPHKVGKHPGFQFTLEFAGGDDVPRKMFVTGTIKEEKLYIALYQATRMHYFDKYYKQVERMFNGMQVI